MNEKSTLRKNANDYFTHTKNEKGITLVALVITIIVLLILAGVTLSMVMGNSGIFGKANIAKEQTQLSNAEETIRLAVLENKVKSVSGDADALTNDTLKTEIGKKLTEQGYTVSGSTVTYYGDKTIDIESYLDKETTYTAYNVGDQVTVGGEKFYVIKASSASEEKVTLLAEKNIDTTTLKQSDTANSISFANTNYWSSETVYPLNLNNYSSSSIKETDAISIAKRYGTEKGGIGRLITYDEINLLPENLKGNKSFWCGTAYSNSTVWNYAGTSLTQFSVPSSYMVAGVRPVIEISKSLI